MLFKILIVDNGSSLFLLNNNSAVWKECGFEISGHTSDINDAIRAMVKKDFDILICINRPASQIASELLHRISQKNKNIPAIVISQFDDSKIMRECFLLGAIDYLIVAIEDSINIPEFKKYCLEPALEMRDIIKTQLGIIDYGEFGGSRIPDIKIKEKYNIEI